MARLTHVQKLFDKGSLTQGDRLAGLLRFALTGGAATLTYLLAFTVLHRTLAWDAKTLSLVAYSFGFCVSYLGQTYFTFRQKGWDQKTFKRFAFMSVFGATLSWGIIAISSDILKWPDHIGAVITALLIPAISFIIMNFWVFFTARP